MNQEITLKLTVNEVNVILAALSKLPYDQVFELVAKVKTQGENQLATPTEPESAE